jgi:two-component system response regulator HydG
VGGEETIPVDVRIIAATNTPAEELQNGDAFREDLFYRLHVVPVTIPPLRGRKTDVPVLARHFLAKLRERTNHQVEDLSETALSRLEDYDWPGNVRELENVMERALVLAEGQVLQEDDLPFLAAGVDALDTSLIDAAIPGGGLDLNQAVEGLEERLLRKALEEARGVKAEAARLLGLKTSALYYKLEKYGIEL